MSPEEFKKRMRYQIERDVERIVSVLAARSRIVTEAEAESVWKEHSKTMSASWLRLPSDDDALADAYMSVSVSVTETDECSRRFFHGDMFTITIELRHDAIPVWWMNARGLIPQMFDELASESQDFADKCDGIRLKYEQLVRDMVGENVLPLHSREQVSD